MSEKYTYYKGTYSKKLYRFAGILEKYYPLTQRWGTVPINPGKDIHSIYVLVPITKEEAFIDIL